MDRTQADKERVHNAQFIEFLSAAQ